MRKLKPNVFDQANGQHVEKLTQMKLNEMKWNENVNQAKNWNTTRIYGSQIRQREYNNNSCRQVETRFI